MLLTENINYLLQFLPIGTVSIASGFSSFHDYVSTKTLYVQSYVLYIFIV